MITHKSAPIHDRSQAKHGVSEISTVVAHSINRFENHCRSLSKADMFETIDGDISK